MSLVRRKKKKPHNFRGKKKGKEDARGSSSGGSCTRGGVRLWSSERSNNNTGRGKIDKSQSNYVQYRENGFLEVLAHKEKKISGRTGKSHRLYLSRILRLVDEEAQEKRPQEG